MAGGQPAIVQAGRGKPYELTDQGAARLAQLSPGGEL
jgi:hypothetical protein